jgi:uncharacterized protein YidB (DUF937 family)
MSEFISQIAGGLAASGGVLSQILGTAEGATGGALEVLIAQFENAGFGSQVRSWLGKGTNLPITSENVTAAIPEEQLQVWADKAGITQEQLAIVLAEVLPQAIAQASPAASAKVEAPKSAE